MFFGASIAVVRAMTHSNGEWTMTLASTRAIRAAVSLLAAGLFVGLLLAAEGCTLTTGTSADASTDTSDSTTCTGKVPDCFTAYGTICDDVVRPGVDYEPKCTATGWKCPPGQIPMNECRGGVPPVFPLDSGPDANVDSGSDASLDAAKDATRD